MMSNTMGGTQTSDTAQEMVQFSGGTFTPSIANMVVCRHLHTRFLNPRHDTSIPKCLLVFPRHDTSIPKCAPFGKLCSCDVTSSAPARVCCQGNRQYYMHWLGYPCKKAADKSMLAETARSHDADCADTW